MKNFEIEVSSYFATHQKKLATHKCVAIPWFRITEEGDSKFKMMTKKVNSKGKISLDVRYLLIIPVQYTIHMCPGVNPSKLFSS